MFTMPPTIKIENWAVREIEKGGLWLGKSAVVGRKPVFPGIIHLVSKRMKFVGQAFLSPLSKIYLRVFSRLKERADREFWRRRIVQAYERRAPLEGITDAYRVVYAEGDSIPSIVIDRYNDVWAIQVTSAGAETIKQDLVDIIARDFSPRSIVEKDAALIRKKEDLPLIERVAYGAGGDTMVREGGMHFRVDVVRGQKTGAYLDYRKIRLMARTLARGICLDAFCYEGWFACQIANVAKEVIAIDSSEDAITGAKENALINSLSNVEFLKSDVFDWLDDCKLRFNFIHLDPPPFARSAGNIEPAIRGYRKLVSKALALLAPGGIILTSSCSHYITERVLDGTVTGCIESSGRNGECLCRAGHDIDHPTRLGFSEGHYLKAVAYRVN